MTKFEDATGREWELSLTAGDLKRLKRDLSVDLRDALKPDGGTVTAVLNDTEKFLDLMWALCGRQAQIPRDQFEMIFDRDTVTGAVSAVWAEVWDFFQGQKAGTQARAALLAASEQHSAKVVNVLETATDWIRHGRTSSNFANTSAVSSDSIIDPSPLPSSPKWPEADAVMSGSGPPL